MFYGVPADLQVPDPAADLRQNEIAGTATFLHAPIQNQRFPEKQPVGS